MPDATTTIETVTVVRPLKVISVICETLALVLVILAACTTAWLKAGSYFKSGLFRECSLQQPPANVWLPPMAAEVGSCQMARIYAKPYFQVTAAFLLLAMAAIFACFVITLIGLRTPGYGLRYLYYRIALYLGLVAFLAELISLIVFPVCFYLELEQWAGSHWELDWSYGVAWGSAICTFFACVLLLADKGHEEVYYKEKTVYVPSHIPL